MSRRAEFTKSTKAQAFLAANGICQCGCGVKLTPGEVQYDHWPVPAALGGSNDVTNCRPLRTKCHRRITAEKDVPTIAKAVRVSEKAMGLRKSSRGFRKAPDGYDSFNRRWRDE